MKKVNKIWVAAAVSAISFNANAGLRCYINSIVDGAEFTNTTFSIPENSRFSSDAHFNGYKVSVKVDDVSTPTSIVLAISNANAILLSVETEIGQENKAVYLDKSEKNGIGVACIQ